MKTRIWIDTVTGTWGTDPERLAIFDASADELAMLDESSDSEIIALGESKL